MNTNRYEKIKNTIIYSIFISLFFTSIFILANERFDILDKLIKPIEKPEEVIKIIDKDAEWSYIKEGQNPGVGNVWAIDRYDAEAWKKGYGDFGGGDESQAKTILELKSENGGNIASYFFRYKFNIKEDVLEEIQALEGKIEYSGAVIVYLNGSIIFAGNVPQGGYSSNLDVGVAEELQERSLNSFEVNDLSALKVGENIIGVEIHQKSTESNDLYFNFHKLNLSKNELEKSSYNMDGLVLEQGNSNEDVFINWMTDSSDFYRVEYIESEKYKSEKDLSKYGQTILMGRKKLNHSNFYINSVQISRLKNNTEYMYRIFKIGNIKGSKMYSFTSGKRSGFSFFLLEGNSIEKFSNKIEDVDFIIISVGREEKQDIKSADSFIAFRKPQILKNIPILTVPGNYEDDKHGKDLYDIQFDRTDKNKDGNYYISYQDTLIICLDSSDKDYNSHKDFIKETISKTKKQWTLVTGYGIEDEEFSNTFKDLNIDLLLDTKKTMAKLVVDNDEILIETYSLETGDIVKTYSLRK